jgi:hypothetical protein
VQSLTILVSCCNLTLFPDSSNHTPSKSFCHLFISDKIFVLQNFFFASGTLCLLVVDHGEVYYHRDVKKPLFAIRLGSLSGISRQLLQLKRHEMKMRINQFFFFCEYIFTNQKRIRRSFISEWMIHRFKKTTNSV